MTGWWTSTATLARRVVRPRVRTTPAVSVPGSELVHLGGGESFPCPDAPRLPLDPAVRRSGLGSASLALPAARVHALRDVVAHPGDGLVVTADGAFVSESLPPDPARRAELAPPDRRARPVELPGTVAVYRNGERDRYHSLVEDLPRAALLAHPAMRRFGTVTLVHDGPLDPLEAWLLPRLVGRHVTLHEVGPGVPVTATRVLLPAHVHRPGAGAVPSWYRRWADRATDLPPVEGARRLLLAGPEDLAPVGNRRELDDALADLDFETIDPLRADPEDLVARCRDAEVVTGLGPAALAHAVFSHRARVVEVLDGAELRPAIYYLAMSKGLPYDYLAAPAPGRPDWSLTVDVDALRSLLASDR